MKAYIAVPAIVLLLYRAWSRQSLSILGLVTAGATASIHALHPWSLPFVLLGIFFIAGTRVTKVKHTQKASYTTSSTGRGGTVGAAPAPRGAAQVLCNSLPASVLVLVHLLLLNGIVAPGALAQRCLAPPAIHLDAFFRGRESALVHALPYGIIAHYAAAAADTFSSELGILATTNPVLITDLPGLLRLRPKKVPRGTNGGVTLLGVAAGGLGAALIALASVALLPFCTSPTVAGKIQVLDHALPEWAFRDKILLGLCITLVGTAGSLLDSFLGAVLQASVVDTHANKIVEGDAGAKVPFSSSSGKATAAGKKTDSVSRKVVAGRDILSNNGVNLLMCSIMAGTGVLLAYTVYADLSFHA